VSADHTPHISREHAIQMLRDIRDDHLSDGGLDYGFFSRALDALIQHDGITADQLQARIDSLEEQFEALRPYVQHRSTCILNVSQSVLREKSWCDCGLTALLDGSSPATTSSGEVLGTETPEAARSASPETSSPAISPKEER